MLSIRVDSRERLRESDPQAGGLRPLWREGGREGGQGAGRPRPVPGRFSGSAAAAGPGEVPAVAGFPVLLAGPLEGGTGEGGQAGDDLVVPDLRLPAHHRPHPGDRRASGGPPDLPYLPRGGVMASAGGLRRFVVCVRGSYHSEQPAYDLAEGRQHPSLIGPRLTVAV
jgi:hypothetical protein